jgi:ELWxxDGT repeat protein
MTRASTLRQLLLIAMLSTAGTALISGSASAAPGDIHAARVADIYPGSNSSTPSDLVDIGGTILFSADDGSNGNELWKTDGTSAGTVRVTDINPGPGNANPAELTDVNGTLFFRADDNLGDEEVYRLDPPYAGPPVKIDVNPTGPSGPGRLTQFNGLLFFAATSNTASGAELWKSNGGAVGSGTEMVANINTNTDGGSFPEELTPIGSTLFFAATDGNDGGDREIWKTSGSGASEVDDITPTAGEGSGVHELTNVAGTLFFSADDLTNGPELWKSDGTDNTMVQVGPPPTGSDPQNLAALGGTLFFNADDGVHGHELWRSDGGTVASGGTALVADINTNPTSVADGYPEELIPFDGKLYFDADDGTHGEELWKTNGGGLGPGGTELVADLQPGPGSSIPSDPVVGAGHLWFRAATAAGNELWNTDGVTLHAADIAPGPASSTPTSLTPAGADLIFSAEDGASTNRELWRASVEGPPATVIPPASPAPPAAPRKKKCKNAKKRAAAAKKKCKKKRR